MVKVESTLHQKENSDYRKPHRQSAMRFLYTGKPSLVVLCMNLEVALGMIADRALVGGIGSNNDMSAVSALPYLHFALCKDSSSLHIL